MEKSEKRIIRFSVRTLVEFLLRHGDIDNRMVTSFDTEAMQKGSRLHRKLQKAMGSAYHAEVSLSDEIEYESYTFRLEGRADGIFENTDGFVIDEIKGTYRNIERMEEADEIHLAQAKCYAAIYLQQQNLQKIQVQITYCHMESEEIRRFTENYSKEEILCWYRSVLEAYRKWAELEVEWIGRRNASMQNLSFPFPYREGQKKLVQDVYRTILRQKQIFVQASTGVGKTMSVVYPSVRALGEGLGEKIFYLTAKTITRTVAEEAFGILREKGLACKNITLTAKEKICVCEKAECNPEICPRAKGHYDRINDALYEMLTEEERYDREAILRQSEKWTVCPHEMQLDLSLFMDAIICDYNYVLDPRVRLKRYFGDGSRKGDYLFLIDEAHNLVDRAREMYSASVTKESFLEMKRLVKPYHKKLASSLDACNRLLLTMKRECDSCSEIESIDSFAVSLLGTLGLLEGFLDDIRRHPSDVIKRAKSDRKKRKKKKVDSGQLTFSLDPDSAGTELISDGEMEAGESETVADLHEIQDKLLEFYFEIKFFSEVFDLLDENYLIYGQHTEEGKFMVRLLCVNPSQNLQDKLNQGRSTVFFSATLLPIQYYRSQLSGRGSEDYAVYVSSPFDPARRHVAVGMDVSSRYTRRGTEEYKRIASYFYESIRQKKGNYIAYFPSYVMMEAVYEVFCGMLSPEREGIRCICQNTSMGEAEREEFLEAFHQVSDETLLGFCVMGGIFSEGIDLTGEKLIGVFIVGPGLPGIGQERELLKRYYDRNGVNGFDYAYRFPGMNKVLQAAGRVIRTAEDKGIVLLLDDRFRKRENRELFPQEWTAVEFGQLEKIVTTVSDFWRPDDALEKETDIEGDMK